MAAYVQCKSSSLVGIRPWRWPSCWWAATRIRSAATCPWSRRSWEGKPAGFLCLVWKRENKETEEEEKGKRVQYVRFCFAVFKLELENLLGCTIDLKERLQLWVSKGNLYTCILQVLISMWLFWKLTKPSLKMLRWGLEAALFISVLQDKTCRDKAWQAKATKTNSRKHNLPMFYFTE